MRIAPLLLLVALPVLAAAGPTTKPVVVAFVGVAHIHTPEFVGILKKRSAEVTVKDVWDPDAARAKRVAATLGAAVVDDPAAVWADPAVTAVVICSQTVRHRDLVLAAAAAHKDVYAEKPIGMTAADAAEMAAAIDKAGVRFTTGYFMRSDPKLIFLRDQIAKGHFGTLTRIRGVNVHNGALGGWFDKDWRWMADPKQSGVGGFGDLGYHSLDAMLWLVGKPVDRATAVTSAGTGRYPGCDEYGEGLFTFHDGPVASLAAGWDDVSNPVTLEVCGTEGHATIVQDKLYFRSKHVVGSGEKKAWTDLPPATPIPIESWLDGLEGKPAGPMPSADEAAADTAVMSAMYDGAAKGTWVDVRH